MYILERAHRKVLFECRRDDLWFQTLTIFFWVHGSMNEGELRTNVRSISRRRGLADANITRFPTSFLILGVWRACLRTGLSLFFSDMFMDSWNFCGTDGREKVE